jgi:hypothetical protein
MNMPAIIYKLLFVKIGEYQLDRSCKKLKKYYAVKNEMNILHTTRRKATWTGHILCRNCLLKHVIEGDRGKDRCDGNMRKKT